MNPFLINNKRNIFVFLQDYIIPEIVITVGLQCTWEFYVNRRQLSLMRKLENRPVYLHEIMTEDEYEKSRKYTMDKIKLNIINDVCSTFYTTIELVFKGCLLLWTWSEDLVKFMGFDPHVEILTSAVFIIITYTIQLIIDLPVLIYDTFVLEQKHGFNKITPVAFAIGMIGNILLICMLVIPTFCGLVWILLHGGKYIFIYVFLTVGVINVVTALILSPVALSMMFRLSPIPDGELKREIEHLALAVNFPLEGIYIMEESSRSSHSNAFFMGLYNCNIVLTDTLVQEFQTDSNGVGNINRGCTTDEILGVIAHELGHWHFHHINKDIWIAHMESAVYLVTLSLLWNWESLFEAFGFIETQPVLIRMIIIGYVFEPISMLVHWKLAAIRRHDEFQADLYAKNLGHGEALKRALCKLYRDNRTYPIYDKLYSNWNFGHPTLLERMAALS